MKASPCICLCFAVFLLFGGTANGTADLYRIQINDVLEVTVWNHPELSKEVVIPKDGCVSYPLVGNILAKGLTAVELEDTIREGLTPYVLDPQVTVLLKRYQKETINVFGAVKNAGAFDYQRGRTLIDYLGLAGGPTNRANLKKLTVSRRDSTDMYSFVIDAKRVIEHGDRELNMELYPDDTIFVPESFISGWRDWATVGGLVISSLTVYVVAKRWARD